jgi:hypothetical protein
MVGVRGTPAADGAPPLPPVVLPAPPLLLPPPGTIVGPLPAAASLEPLLLQAAEPTANAKKPRTNRIAEVMSETLAERSQAFKAPNEVLIRLLANKLEPVSGHSAMFC